MESPVVFYQEAQKSLLALPPFERADMMVGLAKSFEKAYLAYCAGAVPPSGLSVSPSSCSGSARGFRSPVRPSSVQASTGSGYWSVPSGSSVSSEFINTDGKCYLALAARGCRSGLYRKLGPWPTFSRLLASPSGKFDNEAMRGSSFVRVSDGTWHVAGRDHHPPLSTGNVDVLTALARMVEDNADQLQVQSGKWDGTLLRDLQMEPPSLGSVDVPLCSDKVGGFSSRGFAPDPGVPPSSSFSVTTLVDAISTNPGKSLNVVRQPVKYALPAHAVLVAHSSSLEYASTHVPRSHPVSFQQLPSSGETLVVYYDQAALSVFSGQLMRRLLSGWRYVTLLLPGFYSDLGSTLAAVVGLGFKSFPLCEEVTVTLQKHDAGELAVVLATDYTSDGFQTSRLLTQFSRSSAGWNVCSDSLLDWNERDGKKAF